MPLCKHVRDACTQGPVLLLLLEVRRPRVVLPPHPLHRAHTTAMSTHPLTQPLHTTLLRGRLPLRGPGPANCCAWLRCGGSPLCPVLLAPGCCCCCCCCCCRAAVVGLRNSSVRKVLYHEEWAPFPPLGRRSSSGIPQGARNPSSPKAQLLENLSGTGLQARQTNSFYTTRMWRRWRSTVAMHAWRPSAKTHSMLGFRHYKAFLAIPLGLISPVFYVFYSFLSVLRCCQQCMRFHWARNE